MQARGARRDEPFWTYPASSRCADFCFRDFRATRSICLNSIDIPLTHPAYRLFQVGLMPRPGFTPCGNCSTVQRAHEYNVGLLI